MKNQRNKKKPGRGKNGKFFSDNNKKRSSPNIKSSSFKRTEPVSHDTTKTDTTI